jgi:hypothetical protein
MQTRVEHARWRIVMTIIIAGAVLAAAGPARAGGISKATSKVPAAQQLLDQAFAQEKSDVSVTSWKKCVGLAEQADRLDPNNWEILVDISRYYWEYANLLPKQTEVQQQQLIGLYNRGVVAAERSLKIKETSPGHYWLAVNKASTLEWSSIFAQVASFPGLYSNYRYVVDHDPDYYFGAAGRFWVEVLARIPKAVIETLGQKYLDEAVTQINRAIQKEPRYLHNFVYKARFTWSFYANKEETLKLLDQALKADPNAMPDYVTDNKQAQKEARELWKKVTGKEYPQR